MYWPGTSGVLAGPAEVEAEPAERSAGRRIAPAVAVSPVSLVGIPSGRLLPCAGDPDLFFAELPEDVELAKSLCRTCPAKIACLAGAVDRREPWGVWGGELFLRGEVVPRKRPRGRPRKTEAAA